MIEIEQYYLCYSAIPRSTLEKKRRNRPETDCAGGKVCLRNYVYRDCPSAGTSESTRNLKSKRFPRQTSDRRVALGVRARGLHAVRLNAVIAF